MDAWLNAAADLVAMAGAAAWIVRKVVAVRDELRGLRVDMQRALGQVARTRHQVTEQDGRLSAQGAQLDQVQAELRAHIVEEGR